MTAGRAGPTNPGWWPPWNWPSGAYDVPGQSS
jgi:hypothetical protein